MANTYAEQGQEATALVTVQKDYRAWVLGLAFSAVIMAILGLWLASVVPGVARPWTGAAFVVAMGLAIVVGVSKTSSA